MNNKAPKVAVGDTQSNVNVAFKYLNYLNPFNFKNHATKTKAVFALALVCFLWGTTWIASKEGVRYMPALQLAGIRQLAAGLLYVSFFIIRGAPFPKRKDWIPIIVLSLLNFVFSNGFSTWGLQYISAGLGSILGTIFPLWLVVIGLTQPTTTVKTKTLLGLFLSFAGICVIFYEHLYDFLNAEFRIGIFLSIVATWTWAFGTLYTKKNAANFNPYYSLGLQMVISGAALSIISELTNNAVPISSIPWQSWVAIAYLVIFSSVISFIAYLYALQNLPTEQVSIYAYINPIIAVLLGAILFGENLTAFIIIGVLITLYGVYLVNKSAVKINES
ncbi:MAG TPA: EamA family transporter [Flavisolibacter sp.]|nr:EamA family transporter [Flavisolibacter sp.]